MKILLLLALLALVQSGTSWHYIPDDFQTNYIRTPLPEANQPKPRLILNNIQKNAMEEFFKLHLGLFSKLGQHRR